LGQIDRRGTRTQDARLRRDATKAFSVRYLTIRLASTPMLLRHRSISPPPRHVCSSEVERQLPKLLVVGSVLMARPRTPLSREIDIYGCVTPIAKSASQHTMLRRSMASQCLPHASPTAPLSGCAGQGLDIYFTHKEKVVGGTGIEPVTPTMSR
jgi:hypothetical protein